MNQIELQSSICLEFIFQDYIGSFKIFMATVNLSESHSVVSITFQPHGRYRNSPGQNTGVGSRSLLQGIFPSQGSNPSLPRILHQLSHEGNPRILEWVAYHFSNGSSDPGIEPGSPALQADSSPAEPPGRAKRQPKAWEEERRAGTSLGAPAPMGGRLRECARRQQWPLE